MAACQFYRDPVQKSRFSNFKFFVRLHGEYNTSLAL